ncbi:4-oxalomesaconate tautomerase [Rhabdaerophilum sp. SD176]|uniref:4-oxalomesaconate tautomerase n=1 Tax=Rhabdaerophilum sp. SD176 TaxID=2983548 RepID=UPI0024DFDEE3|nr:4-oxalomesaconate tautomerase [Rhabdaerophilum sp. SD176]
METRQIPCMLMRGGTSRGPFFLAGDLPADRDTRDAALISAMGAGHDLQIDGIGGGSPLTSKVAIVSRSNRPNADVDYLFAQVTVAGRRVDTSPNCGNMLSGVGPFAIEKGLVQASSGETYVRIFNVNTGKRIEALIQTPGGRVTYEGDCRIDGVPDAAAPIRLTFLDSAGAKTGKLLPSGAAIDVIGGVSCTLIDAAMPLMIVRAEDLGKTGQESPADLDADRDFMARLEALRIQAGLRMGLGDVRSLVVPKPVLISAPVKGGTLAVRYFMPHATHKALAVTGAVGIATACATAGTIANALVPHAGVGTPIRIEHPAGSIELTLNQRCADGPIEASLIRTARKIFDGSVFVRLPETALQDVATPFAKSA